MTITPQQLRQFRHLFVLADAASELPTIELKFVSYWETLREDLGLADLLLKLQFYVQQQNQNNAPTITLKTSSPEEVSKDLENDLKKS